MGPTSTPMESRRENTFSAQNRETPKRFMIFDRKKGGSVFRHFFTPPSYNSAVMDVHHATSRRGGGRMHGPSLPRGTP